MALAVKHSVAHCDVGLGLPQARNTLADEGASLVRVPAGDTS